MEVRVAINGFGRIGRMVFRRMVSESDINIVAVNASYSPEQLAHMLKYDSVHGKFEYPVEYTENSLIVNGKETLLISERDASKLPWSELGVEVVIEATGKFRSKEAASAHLLSGAKKVLITAPATNEDVTIVMGVNEEKYDYNQHHVISNASCTTNCLAPFVKVLNDNFGIEYGMMTTIHSYTTDQKLLDNMHKDPRRARAAALSMIPTSTGAARALSLVIPELAGRLNGLAIRVPTPDVSLVDLVVNVKEKVTIAEVNSVLKTSSEGALKGILGYTEEPLVSVDFVGDAHSSIIDGLSTMVIGDKQIKILAWYDNEWGYSCRIVDVAKYISKAYSDKRK
jgi:glyceraldehyde 3-phosphate dehydrogenase